VERCSRGSSLALAAGDRMRRHGQVLLALRCKPSIINSLWRVRKKWKNRTSASPIERKGEDLELPRVSNWD
jgi:hypothetical protein